MERATQVDGTSYVVANGGFVVDYVRDDAGVNATPTGSASVISNDSGGFVVAKNLDCQSATLDAHLLIKVPGALFAVDLVIDVNEGECRVSAMVQSATIWAFHAGAGRCRRVLPGRRRLPGATTGPADERDPADLRPTSRHSLAKHGDADAGDGDNAGVTSSAPAGGG